VATLLNIEAPAGIRAVIPETRYRQVGALIIGQVEDSGATELIDGRPRPKEIAARLILNSLSKADLRGVANDMEEILNQP
jgi:hypothetical protein